MKSRGSKTKVGLATWRQQRVEHQSVTTHLYTHHARRCCRRCCNHVSTATPTSLSLTAECHAQLATQSQSPSRQHSHYQHRAKHQPINYFHCSASRTTSIQDRLTSATTVDQWTMIATSGLFGYITVCTGVQTNCCKGRPKKYRKWHFWIGMGGTHGTHGTKFHGTSTVGVTVYRRVHGTLRYCLETLYYKRKKLFTVKIISYFACL